MRKIQLFEQVQQLDGLDGLEQEVIRAGVHAIGLIRRVVAAGDDDDARLREVKLIRPDGAADLVAVEARHAEVDRVRAVRHHHHFSTAELAEDQAFQ